MGIYCSIPTASMPQTRHILPASRKLPSSKELQRLTVTDPAASLSIAKLFIDADPVVKGVLLLLLAASVWGAGR